MSRKELRIPELDHIFDERVFVSGIKADVAYKTSVDSMGKATFVKA